MNAHVKNERTPLHIAASKRVPVRIIRLLLDAGANPNALNGMDRTPLHTAVIASEELPYSIFLDANSEDAVRALLKAGADPKAKDALEVFPSHYTTRGSILNPLYEAMHKK